MQLVRIEDVRRIRDRNLEGAVLVDGDRDGGVLPRDLLRETYGRRVVGRCRGCRALRMKLGDDAVRVGRLGQVGDDDGLGRTVVDERDGGFDCVRSDDRELWGRAEGPTKLVREDDSAGVGDGEEDGPVRS